MQDNPLFKIIGTIFNPDTYRSLNHLGQGQTSAPKSREAMPDYAGMGARQQASAPPKPKPAVKGAAPVKKVIKKAAKKPVVKAKAKSKAEAPGMKSKGKAADKMVEMKKFVNVKGGKK